MMKSFVTEDDIHEYGRTYESMKQEKSTQSGNSVIPNVILNIDVATSYSQEDYKRDSDTSTSQFGNAPNHFVRVVDAPEPGVAEEGEKNDFAASTGTAFTVFLAEGEQLDRAPLPPKASTNALPTEYKIILTKFYCFKESTEGSWADEVYWSASSGSDYGYWSTLKTPVYRNVDYNDTNTINMPLFEGPMGSYASATIEAWEKDDDGEAWIGALRSTLQEMGESILESSLDAAQQDSSAGTYAQAIGAILALIAALIDWFTNHDDEIASHSFTWTRAALDSLASSGNEVALQFEDYDSGGHILYYKVFRVTNSTRSDAMSVWTRHRDWSLHSTIPGPQTKHSTLVIFNDKLYAILQRNEDKVLLYSEYSDSTQQWLWPRNIEGATSRTRDHPRAVAAHGELWIAFTGLERSPRLIRTKGGDLNSWLSIVKDENIWGGNITAQNGPGFAYVDGHLYYGIRQKHNDQLSVHAYNHPNPDFHPIDIPRDCRPYAYNGIQMVTFQNDLYYFVIAKDHSIDSYRRTPSGTCTRLPDRPGVTYAVPVVTVVADRIYVIALVDGQYESKYWIPAESRWVNDARFGNPKYSGGGINYKSRHLVTGAKYE
jgi:hypothetical protein